MKPNHPLTRTALAATLSVLGTAALRAQTAWDGGGGNTDYSNNLNWAGDIIPGNGNANGASIGNGSNQTVVYSTATSYTSTGTGAANSLLVGTGTFGVGSLTLNGSAGTLTFGGDDLNNAAKIGSDATGTVTVSAGKLAITGGVDASLHLGVSGGLASSGTLLINGGTVDVNGRILMGANSNTATGLLTLTTGTLDMKRTSTALGADNGRIQLGAGTNTVNLDGGTAILSGFNITAASNVLSNIYFNGTTIKANVATTDFINGTTANANLQIKNGGLVFDTNGFNVTINDALSNFSGHTGTLRKEGTGTLTLSGTGSSFTGNINITGGTLQSGANINATNPTTSPLGNPQTAGRTITIGSGAFLTFAGNDSLGNASSTPVVKLIVNGGTINNAGNFFTTLGPVDLNAGTINSVGGAAPGFPSFALGGTITVGGSAASTISGSGTNSQMVLGTAYVANTSTTFNVADATSSSASDLNISVVLQNSGGNNGLTKAGAGTLTLSGANSYTGNTLVNAGSLAINGSYAGNSMAVASVLLIGASNGTNGNVIIGSGAGTLSFGGDVYTSAAQVGTNGGTGALTLNGGTTNISGASGQSASLNIGGMATGGTGTVTVNSGTLNIGARILMASNVNAANGTLTINGGAVNVGYSGGLSFGSNQQGILRMGFGTTAVNLNGGTLSLFAFQRDAGTGIADINFNGGTLKALGSPNHFLSNAANNGIGAITTRVRTGGAVIDTNSFNITIATALLEDGTSPGGGLTKQGGGTLTLSAANTYTGATTITTGKLTIGTTGTINSTSGVTIGTASTAATSEFNYNSSTALTKTVSFAAGSTGGTLSGSATIEQAVNVTTGNTLAIGNSVGTMNFGSDLILDGTYLYELTGGAATADLGNVTGILALGGVLDLVQLGTYTVNNKFTLFGYQTGLLTGTFAGLANNAEFTDAGGVWKINYADITAGLNGGTGTRFVTVTAIPEPSAALLVGLGLLALLRRRR